MINPLKLGATLFVPASSKNLFLIINKEKYSFLKSIAIDFEDGYDGDDIYNIVKDIDTTKKNSLIKLIRFADYKTLSFYLHEFKLENIDGFILPKFSLKNAQEYINIIKDSSFKYKVSISIEEDELFDIDKLKKLKLFTDQIKDKVINIRFGAEDMFKQLSLRRDCDKSLFDYSVASSVIADIIKVFKIDNYEINGAVFRCFNDDKNFIKDVKRDLSEGLVGKSVIHPKQVKLFDEVYKVDKSEYDEAIKILNSTTKVANLNGTMLEKITQNAWASKIISRSKIYGIKG